MAPAATGEKILVIKLSALGDFIQALGPMAAIRKHHPHAHITLLTTKPFVGFGEKCGYFDAVLCDTRPKTFDIKGWLALRKTLREGHYLRVYDLQNNDRSNFYFRLFPKAERPEWVGTARGASHENNSASRTAGFALEGHIETLGLAGVGGIQIDNFAWVKEDISEFGIQKPYILFVPGCAPRHPHKRWPGKSYATIAPLLQKGGFQVILIGTEAEREVTSAIASTSTEILDLTGKTSLLQIAALAREASGAIGNDTGPMHMIAPTGCPSLVLFSGASNPQRHAPRGAYVQVIQREPLSALNAAEVLENFYKLLSRQPEGALNLQQHARAD